MNILVRKLNSWIRHSQGLYQPVFLLPYWNTWANQSMKSKGLWWLMDSAVSLWLVDLLLVGLWGTVYHGGSYVAEERPGIQLLLPIDFLWLGLSSYFLKFLLEDQTFNTWIFGGHVKPKLWQRLISITDKVIEQWLYLVKYGLLEHMHCYNDR